MVGTSVEIRERVEKSFFETIGVVVEIPFGSTEVEGVMSQEEISVG